MERAKRALAEEAKKVYLVRRLDSIEDLRGAVHKAAASGAPELAKAAALELRKKELENLRLKERMTKRKGK